MGVHVRQNSKIASKDMIAAISIGSQTAQSQAVQSRTTQSPTGERRLDKVSAADAAHAMTTLQVLAAVYEQIADRLLEQMRLHADDRKSTRLLGHHLDWIGMRAQMIDRFVKAGDGATACFCAAKDGPARLLPLAQLAARNAAAPHGLPVALFLLEKIDEELRLA